MGKNHENLQKELSFFVMLFLFVLSIYFPELNLEETLSDIWDEYDQSQGVHQHTVGHQFQQLHLIGLALFLYLCINRYTLKAKSYFTINFVLNSSFDLKKTCEIWSKIEDDMTFLEISYEAGSVLLPHPLCHSLYHNG